MPVSAAWEATLEPWSIAFETAGGGGGSSFVSFAMALTRASMPERIFCWAWEGVTVSVDNFVAPDVTHCRDLDANRILRIGSEPVQVLAFPFEHFFIVCLFAQLENLGHAWHDPLSGDLAIHQCDGIEDAVVSSDEQGRGEDILPVSELLLLGRRLLTWRCRSVKVKPLMLGPCGRPAMILSR